MLLTQITHETLNLINRDLVNYAFAPFVIPLISTAINVGAGIIKGIKSNKEKNEALDAINNYERQKLENVYKDTPYYNEAARRLAQKQIRENLGTSASAAMQGGARTYGIIESAQRQADEATLKQSAFEQDAFIQHQRLVAEDDARIRQIQENREISDISGLSSLYEAGRQGEMSAITEIGQGIAGGLAYIGGSSGTSEKSNQSAFGEIGKIYTPNISNIYSKPISDVQLDYNMPTQKLKLP